MKRSLVAMLGLCLAHPALAASTPPTTVLLGTVAASTGTGTNGHHCNVTGGPAMFQGVPITSVSYPRSAVVLDLPAVSVSEGEKGVFTLTGVLGLRFTSTTVGYVHFDYLQRPVTTDLPAGTLTPFNNYNAIWAPEAGTLKVSFNIQFGHCNLPVLALFRTVP